MVSIPTESIEWLRICAAGAEVVCEFNLLEVPDEGQMPSYKPEGTKFTDEERQEAAEHFWGDIPDVIIGDLIAAAAKIVKVEL